MTNAIDTNAKKETPTMTPNCLINQSACGRIAGNPVCPQCGMDERVVYPGQADREAAQTAAKARYWEAYARQLEAAQTVQAAAAAQIPLAAPVVDGPAKTDLNPQAPWPFPSSTKPPQSSNGNDSNQERQDNEAHAQLRTKTLNRIRNGWICAAISAVVTFLIAVLGPVIGLNPLNLDTSEGEHLFDLIDVVLVALLGFGVQRKNRWAATALFVYFLVSKALMATEYGTVGPLVGGFVFGYFFFMGMWGCFAWHKHFAHETPWPFPVSKTP